jgi:hypothetical protein
MAQPHANVPYTEYLALEARGHRAHVEAIYANPLAV